MKAVQDGTVLATALAFGALSLACEGEEGLSAEDALAQRLSEAMCAAAHEKGCDCGPVDYTQQVCEHDWLGTIRHVQLQALDGGAQFDAACLDEHIAAIEQLDCTLAHEYLVADVHPTCQLYYGDKQLGDACMGHSWASISTADRVLGYWMSDCEQGLFCVVGRCVTPQMPWVMLEPDAPCYDTDNGLPLGVCPQGQGCNYMSGLCAPLAAEGESCAGGIQCADSWCDATVCAPRKPDGESCESSAECTGGWCDEGVCRTAAPRAMACFPFAL